MGEWKEYKLSDIATEIGDGLHGTPKYSIDGNCYFINGNNIVNGKVIIKDDTKRISDIEFDLYKKPLFDRTILLSINGTIGNVGLYNGEKCILGKSVCYLNIKNSVDKRFIYYTFLSNSFQTHLRNIATGTTILNVPLKSLRETVILLPSLDEQKRIASILSSLDDKIDLLHRENKTLEAMAETLFRKWFIEDAKEEWKEGRLDDILSVKGGTTPSTKESKYWDGNISWTSPKDVTTLNGIYLFDTERKITKEGLKQISSGLLPAGTLLMSSRAPVGVLAYAEIPLAINQGYIAIIDDKGYAKEFIYLWLKANMDMVHSYANGSTFMEISKSAFKSLSLQIPPKHIVDEFCDRIKPIFEKIKINELQIRTINKTKDNILPKLMSNEIKIDEL